MDHIFDVKGMSCGGCVRSVTRVVERLEGVDEVEVSLEEARAVVRGEIAPEVVVAAIEKAGFQASPAADSSTGGM